MGESSRKGEPWSRRAWTRSRGSSLPRPRCRSRAALPPPCSTSARRAFRSATRPRIACALRANSAPRVSSDDLITLIAARPLVLSGRHPRAESGAGGSVHVAGRWRTALPAAGAAARPPAQPGAEVAPDDRREQPHVVGEGPAERLAQPRRQRVGRGGLVARALEPLDQPAVQPEAGPPQSG